MRSTARTLATPTALAVAAALALGSIFVAPSLANAGKPEKNIVQVAREAGTFQTLLAAVKAADLVGTLSGQGQGPFTVFAPNDAAFAKLPAGTVESLLNDPAALKNILLYHVVPGELNAAEVTSRSSLTAANGGTLTIDGATVNGSQILATDVMARNGVIHVIDTVLIP